MPQYDIIGDIHGYASTLNKLLLALGYTNDKGYYSHPSKKVIFLGDYIDRGPEILETLEIVKSMVDHNMALAIMGNHEYNAIGYNLQNEEGTYLRPHTSTNTHQHAETLNQFKGKESLYNEYIDWFKTLPLYLDLDDIRVVHASWDLKSIDYLNGFTKNSGILTINDLIQSFDNSTDLFKAVENVLKGKEIDLPSGHYFMDKDGTKRCSIRIKWWENFINPSINDLSVIDFEPIYNDPISCDLKLEGYDEKLKPVFFGHYWLKGEPELLKCNVCCLDYSVAKNGYLTAYSYKGEKKLSDLQFIYIK